MDLGAYAQIEDLEQVMKDNNIDIPRLRGLRLMKNEEPITRAEMEDHWEWIGVDGCVGVCQTDFKMHCYCYELSERTDKIIDKYMIRNSKGHPIGIKWDKIHGKKRKAFKYELRKAREKVLLQDRMFNKYCGRDDVLYIHARLGSGNWGSYNCDNSIKNQPWYLEHCEDAFDCTYVDIYAKIGGTNGEDNSKQDSV